MLQPLDILLLAAGKSTRMGQNKLLLPAGDRSVIEHMLLVLKNVPGSKTTVITGFEGDLIAKTARKPDTTIILNSHFENGMTSSIQAGIRSLNRNSDGVMILPADLPLIDAKNLTLLVNKFHKAYSSNPACIIVATDQGKLKNPVIFSRHYYAAILTHPNPHGCKQIVEQNLQHVVPVEINNPYFFHDIDTPEDYQVFLNETARRNS